MEEDMELWNFLAMQKANDTNFTHKNFATNLDISKGTLSKIINYSQMPGVKLAMKIQKITEGRVKWWKLIERCMEKGRNL